MVVGSPEIFKMVWITYRSKFFFNIFEPTVMFYLVKIDINLLKYLF
jgi:hypothetical protein